MRLNNDQIAEAISSNSMLRKTLIEDLIDMEARIKRDLDKGLVKTEAECAMALMNAIAYAKDGVNSLES